MTGETLYKNFMLIFPYYDSFVSGWVIKSGNHLQIKLVTGNEYMFTFFSMADWKFETIKSYEKQVKNNNKLGGKRK